MNAFATSGRRGARVRLLAAAALALGAAPLPEPADPPAPFLVRGFVLDSSLRPVAGASVTATPLQAGARACRESAAAAPVASDGRFSIALGAMPPLLRLEALAPGLAPGVIDGFAPAASPADAGVLFLLPAVELTGRVTNRHGAPLGGASLFVMAASDPLPEAALEPAAVSAPDGTFCIDGLPPAVVWIGATLADHADLARREADLNDPARRDVDLVLDDGRSVRGVVLGEHGQPLPGAKVEPLWPRGEAPFFRRPVTTSADGRFLLEGLPAARGGIEVRFAAAGLQEALRPGASLEEDSVVTLARAPLLRLSAAAADPPVAISLVRLDAYARAGEGWRREERACAAAEAEVERPDCWTVSAPPGERIRVFVEAEDGRTAVAEVAPPAAGETVDVRLEFAPLREIAGRVLAPDGAPPAGPLDVELGRAHGASWLLLCTARCAQDGGFSCAGLPDGAYGVRARSASWISDWVPAGEGSAPVPLAITARPAARLSGTLTVNGKRPPLPIVVAALAFDRGHRAFRAVATAATDPEGRFLLAPLPAGAVALVPEQPPDPGEGACAWRKEPALPEGARGWPWLARLGEGEEAVLDIDLLQPARSWLSGTFEVNGRRRPGALLALSRADGDGRGTVLTDEEGRFRCRVEGGGGFVLEVEAGGPRAALPVDVQAGIDRSIAWDVAAGSIGGRLLAAEGTPGLRVLLQAERAPTQDDPSPWATCEQALASPDGRYAFPEAAARRLRVAAEDPSGRLAMAVTGPFPLGAGESATAPDLVLPLAAALEAVMRLPAGGKPPFARLEVEAAAGLPDLPRPFTGWFVAEKARVAGLPPGRVRARLLPYGPFEASPDQEVDLPADGSCVTIEFTVRPAGR
ncbi:MAG: carboxypeptidase regulatory-like domain-containing protein [Planctomycetes bacterium]|nr:carboxypeptidase regulatory-like domain-containing protein [Planctomycetota bacterium]